MLAAYAWKLNQRKARKGNMTKMTLKKKPRVSFSHLILTMLTMNRRLEVQSMIETSLQLGIGSNNRKPRTLKSKSKGRAWEMFINPACKSRLSTASKAEEIHMQPIIKCRQFKSSSTKRIQRQIKQKVTTTSLIWQVSATKRMSTTQIHWSSVIYQSFMIKESLSKCSDKLMEKNLHTDLPKSSISAISDKLVRAAKVTST